MSTIALTDIFFRGGALSLLILVASVFLFRHRESVKSASFIALAIGTAGYIIASSPNLPFFSGWPDFFATKLAGMLPVLVYWAGNELFLDRFHPKPWQIVAGVIIVAVAWFHPILPDTIPVRGVLVILLYAHLLFVVFSTNDDDLLEGRRKFRTWLLCAMAILGASIGLIELFNLDENPPEYIFPLHAFVFLALTLVFALWAFDTREGFWVISDAMERKTAKAEPTPADRALLTKLERAMEAEIWRTENLTVSKLASELSTPDHRIRKVINQTLGHRNFSSYINQHRIAGARRVLEDPEKGDIPILTIAHDVGFASLGPFNRAFREVMGENPTQFRRKKMANPSDS